MIVALVCKGVEQLALLYTAFRVKKLMYFNTLCFKHLEMFKTIIVDT